MRETRYSKVLAIEPGRLALVAGITVALDALGNGPIEWELAGRPAQLALGGASIDAEPLSRAVISDDGETIWLTLPARTPRRPQLSFRQPRPSPLPVG